jgi:hypothetical protein
MTKSSEASKLQAKVMESLNYFNLKDAVPITKDTDCIITLKRTRTANGAKNNVSTLSFNSTLVKTVLERHSDSMDIVINPKFPEDESKRLREFKFAISFGKKKADPRYIVFNASSNIPHIVVKRKQGHAYINNKALVNAIWYKLNIPEDAEDIKFKVELETTIQNMGFYKFTILDKKGKPFFSK